jgi:hypothetical protein
MPGALNPGDRCPQRLNKAIRFVMACSVKDKQLDGVSLGLELSDDRFGRWQRKYLVLPTVDDIEGDSPLSLPRSR